MFKLLFVISSLFYGCVMFTLYHEITRKEELIPIAQRVQKSHIHRVIRPEWFDQLNHRAPRIASFVIGLDSEVSRVAWVRWAVLILLGWIHFCFFSRWSKNISYIISKKHLFILPIGVSVITFLAKFVHIGLEHFSPTIGKYFSTIVGVCLMTVFVPIILVSLFSIPISFMLAGLEFVRSGTKMTQRIACYGWSYGERIFGTPKSGFAMRFSNYIASVKQNHNEKKSARVQGKAELPGPIVKKRMIDGVWYND